MLSNKNVNVEMKKCPRCKRNRNSKGFRQNPDPKYNNEICWVCHRQASYHVDQNRVSINELGIPLERARELVFDHYGRFCACCGESEPKFLEIDHVNNDGAEHRQMIGRLSIYVWIVNNNFPNIFQVLCSNCNKGKYRNGGACPHIQQRLRLVS